MSYINYLDLPPLPLDIESDILETVSKYEHVSRNDELLISTNSNLKKIIEYSDYDPNTNIGYHYSSGKKIFPDIADYDFLEPSDAVKNWVVNNINLDCLAFIQVMSNGTVVPPHIDEARSKAINYLIETGGEASTTFYQPKNEYKKLSITPQVVIPYTRLDVIESTVIEKKLWHELDVKVIHGVENISSRRLALTLCPLTN